MLTKVETVEYEPTTSTVIGSFVAGFKKYRFKAIIDPFMTNPGGDFEYSIVSRLSIVDYGCPFEYYEVIPLRKTNRIARKLVSYLSTTPVVDVGNSRICFVTRDKKNVVASFGYLVWNNDKIDVFEHGSNAKFFSSGDNSATSPMMLGVIRLIRDNFPEKFLFKDVNPKLF